LGGVSGDGRCSCDGLRIPGRAAAGPQQPGTGHLRSQVPWRAGGHAKIRYRLPDGTLKFEDVPLPWESNVLYFRYRDKMVVEAVATDVNRLVPLQCVAISDPEDPKGTTFLSSRAGNCRAEGKAGGHPQSLPT
jgi:hypothetical protein